VKSEVREIIKLCEYKKVEMIEGEVCMDHIHLCVALPPTYNLGAIMQKKFKRIWMALIGVAISGICVGIFNTAALGTDPLPYLYFLLTGIT